MEGRGKRYKSLRSEHKLKGGGKKKVGRDGKIWNFTRKEMQI